MPTKLFPVDSNHWKSTKPPHWIDKHAGWNKTIRDIKADTAGRYKTIGGALFTVFSLGLGLVPGASLLIDAPKLARIVQRYDPSFKLMHDQMSEHEQKIALLAHVQNKILSEKLEDREAGMNMGNDMARIAARVARSRQHPDRLPARQVLQGWLKLRRDIARKDPKFFQRHNENRWNVAVHTIRPENLPAHLRERRQGALVLVHSTSVPSRPMPPVNVPHGKPTNVVPLKPRPETKPRTLRKTA